MVIAVDLQMLSRRKGEEELSRRKEEGEGELSRRKREEELSRRKEGGGEVVKE